MSTITPVTLEQLTTKSIEGPGVFDTLMAATREHLEREFSGGRIKGQEYANVYLGSLTQVLQTSVAFLLQKDDNYQKVLLTEAQVALANEQVKLAGFQQQLLAQQVINAGLEAKNLIAQECLLRAQYDLAMANNLQTAAQTSLVQQKIATEKAQTVAGGVDADSVVGKQKLLYAAQTNGFDRDAEQKAAKTLIDTWNVRRTTDDATVADGVNMLNDATIGRVVTKLLTGVKA